MKGLVTLLALLSCLTLTACGGSSDGWKTINPPGTQCSFELPEPVTNPKRDGYQLYEAKDGTNAIQVGIFPRAFAEPAPGATDADILNKFEQTILKGVQDNLINTGYDPQLEFEGDLAVEDGLGQQIRIRVGQQYVLNLFYITPRGLCYIKSDNGDKSNPTVARIIDSLKP